METNSNASEQRPEDNPGSLQLPGFLFTLSQAIAKINAKQEDAKLNKFLEIPCGVIKELPLEWEDYFWMDGSVKPPSKM